MRDGIRRATPDDAAAIVAVLAEAFSEYRAQYTAAAYAATVRHASGIRNRLSEGPVWVAVRDGIVVGTISIVPREDEVYLLGMAVVPAARGKGIGRGLLRRVEAVARKERKRRLVLSTTPFLDRAIRLYEAFGFRRTDEGPYDLHGTPLYTMERRLEPS